MFNSLKKVWIGSALAAVSIGALALAQTTKPAAAGKPYPLDVCIMSGEKLGSMGAPEVLVYEGREIKFCCSNCLDDFKKDPTAALKKLDAALAAAPTTKPAAH